MNNQIECEASERSGYWPKNKIHLGHVRRFIQLVTTFLLSYGAYIFGNSAQVFVPTFQCIYVPSKTSLGICKTLVSGPEAFMKLTGTQLLFVGLMVLSILLLGKIWCGYLCPFGLFQDLLTSLRRKLKITPFRISSNVTPFVKMAKWGVLICFLFGIGFCSWCPVKYVMVPLAGGFPFYNLTGIIISGIVAGSCFMRESAFCLVCPLGTLMGLLTKVSGARIKKRGAGCTHCRACIEACPMGIEEIYQVRNDPDVTHPDCIFCMRCLEACPEDGVLSATLLGRQLAISKREL